MLKKEGPKNNVKYMCLLALGIALGCFVVLEIVLTLLDVAEPVAEDKHHIVVRHATFNPFLMWGPNIDLVKEQTEGGNAVWNSQGFRMANELPAAKEEHEYRIFALGGSTTENHFNFANVHYAQLAQGLMRARGDAGPTTSIVNAATSGYSTAHTLIRLQFDILQYNPDMITVMHNYNDLTANYFDSSTPKFNYANKYTLRHYEGNDTSRTIKDAVLFILRQSRVLIAAGQLFKDIEQALETAQVSRKTHDITFTDQSRELVLADAFRNNLNSIVAVAKQHGVDVVLMSQPATFRKDKIRALLSRIDIVYPKADILREDFERYNRIVAEVAKENNVPFIDMYHLFGHDAVYFVDMIHYSKPGIERFSKIYSKQLSEILLQK